VDEDSSRDVEREERERDLEDRVIKLERELARERELVDRILGSPRSIGIPPEGMSPLHWESIEGRIEGREEEFKAVPRGIRTPSQMKAKAEFLIRVQEEQRRKKEANR
jgi:hypothetical protein